MSKLIIEFSNEHEVARLVNLINDGFKILNHQNRTQRGIDGYTSSDLKKWNDELTKFSISCKYADSDIF